MNEHIKRLIALPVVFLALVAFLYVTQEDTTIAKNVAIVSVPVILIQSFLYYRRYKKEGEEEEFLASAESFSRLFVDINAFFPKQQSLVRRINGEKPQKGNNGTRDFSYITHVPGGEIERTITLGTFLAADITGRENFRHMEELTIQHTFLTSDTDYRLVYDKEKKEFQILQGALEVFS